MSLQPFLPWLLAAFTAAVLGQVAGARLGMPWLSAAAAALLPIAAIVVADKINRPHGPYDSDQRIAADLGLAARRNARLIALTWGAGAASMLAVYLGSGLRWQHGWQYGTGMTLIAALSFAYALRLGAGNSPLAQRSWLDAAALAAAVQGVAAFAGLSFLVASGKVWSTRADWAANIIFVAGGLALAGLSALAVRTHLRLR